MQPDIAQRLTFGDRALREILEAMPRIHFDSDNKPHLYAVTLHASIVQLCGGCLALGRTEHTAGIPVLLRSMFEALIDLDNLVSDASYHERMNAANLDQFIKLLKASSVNPLLAGLDKKHDVQRVVAEFQAELDGLRARKRGQKDLRARCVDIGRENEYTSIYTLLCLDAHNNIASLVDRHVSAGEAESLRVDAFGDGNPMSLARRIHLGVGWMLQSATFVHGAFQTNYDVGDLMREHDAMRGGAT